MKHTKLLKFSLCVIAFFALVFLGMYLSQLSTNQPVNVNGVDYTINEEVVVEIKGEVKSPGKYSVPIGTPLHDALYMADGLTDEGDPKSVNLSGFITKSCTVIVEKKKDYVEPEPSIQTSASIELCDINTASLHELTKLPDIGETLAQNIINYRKVNGNFKTTEEIKNVKGIGDKKYDKLKGLIKVGG